MLHFFEMGSHLVLLIGDEIELKLIKEGKEPGQAIGYTDDGTMIVVNGAKAFIGQEKDVVVTSLLDTQGGKIIFGKLKAE